MLGWFCGWWIVDGGKCILQMLWKMCIGTRSLDALHRSGHRGKEKNRIIRTSAHHRGPFFPAFSGS
jgi:hypothetical protein